MVFSLNNFQKFPFMLSFHQSEICIWRDWPSSPLLSLGLTEHWIIVGWMTMYFIKLVKDQNKIITLTLNKYVF